MLGECLLTYRVFLMLVLHPLLALSTYCAWPFHLLLFACLFVWPRDLYMQLNEQVILNTYVKQGGSHKQTRVSPCQLSMPSHFKGICNLFNFHYTEGIPNDEKRWWKETMKVKASNKKWTRELKIECPCANRGGPMWLRGNLLLIFLSLYTSDSQRIAS